MNDSLIEYFSLFRDESFIFHGEDEGKRVIGLYNRGKINPKEPDLRLYYFNAAGEREEREFLALWTKESKTGRKYLIGNKDGVHYVGLINFNRLDNSEPYLTIYWVLKKYNKGDFKNE